MDIKTLIQKVSEDDSNIKINETPYISDNRYVPRVTSIISDMINEEYLMGWSNYLGFKRKKYKEVLNEAANKGTYTHDYIEDYIKNNVDPEINTLPIQYQKEVTNAFSSFKVWWNMVIENDIEIVLQETPLVCKWFGGTLDLLIKINGKYYLLDFKTSNHPSYKHFLQLSAYIDMVSDIHNIQVDGCGTIMLSKKDISFTEILMDFSHTEDVQFMNNCKETFYSLVYSYYNKQRVESQFKNILKKVN